jgi:hypothetical protein
VERYPVASRPRSVPVLCVRAGEEPVEFTAHFFAWNSVKSKVSLFLILYALHSCTRRLHAQQRRKQLVGSFFLSLSLAFFLLLSYITQVPPSEVSLESLRTVQSLLHDYTREYTIEVRHFLSLSLLHTLFFFPCSSFFYLQPLHPLM